VKRESRRRAKAAGWESLYHAVDAGTNESHDLRHRLRGIESGLTLEEEELALETFRAYRTRVLRWLALNRPR
jgi:hypothetical protein